MKNLTILFLAFIIVFASFLRFYKLDQFPPALNWDELAGGYNAYTIAHWGEDEYGTKFPITFKSFGDDKHPVHIYLTAPIVGIFGLNDFSTRASSAAIGVFGVVAMYFLAKKLLKSETAGIFAALFLAVSPYHLHFSRGLWEANFAISFFLIGLALFFWGIEKKNWMIPASVAAFGLSFFSYHSAKVVVPPVALALFLIHFKKIFENKKILIISLVIALVFAGLVVRDPKILGFARIGQTKFSEEEVTKAGGKVNLYVANYKKYFTYKFLFEKGDTGPRQSVKVIGEFYKIDLVLGIIGIAFLVFTKNWQAFLILFLWLALSPIPGVVSTTDPSANRGIFLIGPIVILSGGGASFILTLLKRKWMGAFALAAILILLGREVYGYLKYYYQEYPRAEAIEWQYGIREVVNYLKSNPDYVQVYMDSIRQQPYIFFLYYLKVPLPELLSTVRYDESQAKSYNTVASFGKYQFGGWDIIESYPNQKVIYIMTPSFYTGLRHINSFDVKALIKYPNGNDAFYIVGVP